MNWEDIAKNIVEQNLKSNVEDTKAISNITSILKSVYDFGCKNGENELRNKVTSVFSKPVMTSDELKKELMTVISHLK